MGMDMYIDRIKRNPNNKEEIIERVKMVYWRKFWDLHFYMGLYKGDEYDIDVRLTKGDIEKILNFCSKNRDFFGTYDTVSAVCEVLDLYDEYIEDGWEIVYNANW